MVDNQHTEGKQSCRDLSNTHARTSMKYSRLDSGVDAVGNVGTWLRKHMGTKGQC